MALLYTHAPGTCQQAAVISYGECAATAHADWRIGEAEATIQSADEATGVAEQFVQTSARKHYVGAVTARIQREVEAEHQRPDFPQWGFQVVAAARYSPQPEEEAGQNRARAVGSKEIIQRNTRRQQGE